MSTVPYNSEEVNFLDSASTKTQSCLCVSSAYIRRSPPPEKRLPQETKLRFVTRRSIEVYPTENLGKARINKMKLLLFSLPNDILDPILAYLDGTDLAHLFCSGCPAIHARLWRLQAFRYTIPKSRGPIDWVKCTSLIPRFEVLSSVILVASNPIQPCMHALELSLLPSTLTNLELRFRGIVDEFAAQPTLFSHLKNLESLNIEQRDRIASISTCVWLLELPKSLLRLRIWAISADAAKPGNNLLKDMTSRDTRLWIYSAHVDALVAVGKVVDFKSNLSAMKSFVDEPESTKSIVEEVNKRASNIEHSEKSAESQYTEKRLFEIADYPFFGVFGSGWRLNLTHLNLALGVATRHLDFALLPPCLVEICVSVEPWLNRRPNRIANVDHVNYRNFRYLRVLALGEYTGCESLTWSWVSELPQSLQKLQFPFVPIFDQLALQELANTFESRNNEYFNRIENDINGVHRLVPALLKEFIMTSTPPTARALPIPPEIIHCFSSIKEANISETINFSVPSIPTLGRNLSKTEKNGCIWPVGLERINADNFVVTPSSTAMIDAYSAFLAHEASMKMEENNSKSQFSNSSPSSSQSSDAEASPSSSSSLVSQNLNTSSSSHWTFSGGQDRLNKFPNVFNFCASTLTSLTVYSGFDVSHVDVLPFTLQEIRLTVFNGDVWSTLCDLAVNHRRLPNLSIIALLRRHLSIFPANISTCPPTVHTLELHGVVLHDFNATHLINVRKLAITYPPLPWSVLHLLPPHLESLEFEMSEKIYLSHLSSESPFPRSLQHLHIGAPDENTSSAPSPFDIAGCPFKVRYDSLPIFLDDEARFYRNILQGLDSLTSISLPFPQSIIVLSHFRGDVTFRILKLSFWRRALHYWMYLRLPFYGFFYNHLEKVLPPTEVLTQRRVKNCIFDNAKGGNTLSAIKWHPYKHAETGDFRYLPIQTYFDLRGIDHRLQCERSHEDEVPAVITQVVTILPALTVSLVKVSLSAIYALYSRWNSSPETQILENISNSAKIADSTLLGTLVAPFTRILPSSVLEGLSTSYPMLKSIPWLRIWFILSAYSTFAVTWRTCESRQHSTVRALSTRNRVKKLFTDLLHDRPGQIWLALALCHIFFPILFPSKTTFWLLEASIGVFCTTFAYFRV